MPRAFAVYMLLLAVVIPVSVVTWLVAGLVAAQAVSMLGTLLVVLGTLAYVVFWDSRSRWPEASASQRLNKVLTFTR